MRLTSSLGGGSDEGSGDESLSFGGGKALAPNGMRYFFTVLPIRNFLKFATDRVKLGEYVAWQANAYMNEAGYIQQSMLWSNTLFSVFLSSIVVNTVSLYE